MYLNLKDFCSISKIFSTVGLAVFWGSSLWFYGFQIVQFLMAFAVSQCSTITSGVELGA